MNPSILILDDSEAEIGLITSILTKNNYKIHAFTSPEKALKFLTINEVDLILLDVVMPDFDGFTVGLEIKELSHLKDVPLIFLTGRKQPNDINKGFSIGAVDYVTKPFNNLELIYRVKTHIDLKNSKDLLSEKNEELNKLNAMKDLIFSVIAHDLKSPLATLKSIMGLITDDLPSIPSESMQNNFVLLDESVKQTLYLLENLLSWSRAQNGTLAYNPEPISVYKNLQYNLELAIPQARQKNINVINLLKSDDIKIFADKASLNIIVRNILANALKFSFRKSEIHLYSKELPDFVEIRIRDFGQGMSEDSIEKVLNPHSHYTTWGTENEKGSGLGLKLCQDLIKLNKGRLQIISKKDVGSEFRISFPKLK